MMCFPGVRVDELSVDCDLSPRAKWTEEKESMRERESKRERKKPRKRDEMR